MTREPTPSHRTPVDPITHDDTRANIPTPELEPVMEEADKAPIRAAYARRNPDLDPQLIWRGKDIDATHVTADAAPLYLQEQVHPKAIIEDLRKGNPRNGEGAGADLFDHFGVTDEDAEAEVEFYRHATRWSNRMILGDGLQVMASLAEREGLKGSVQAIYIDPPYGIKFNSNFQWSTTSRDVKDGNLAHLTREPEQVKAFRDTWRDGIHSYLQYLRDRLVVARELLTESGSCFVQIGDENVHRVRALMDEVFGEENFVAQIYFQTAANQNTNRIQRLYDCIIWYKGEGELRFNELFRARDPHEIDGVFSATDPISGNLYKPSQIKNKDQIDSIARAGRLTDNGRYWKRYLSDFPVLRYDTVWKGTVESTFSKDKVYVVQTNRNVVERCLLMTTRPGDLVLDPTCGSGTTAYVAEQWGRRWITIDTSRVALALARARIMGAKYPWYLLADSPEGQRKEAEVTRSSPATHATYDDIRHGFVYHRVPHITLKSIANNTEIDEIWASRQPAVEAALAALNTALAGHPIPYEVQTGGRKGQVIDFTASGEVELPSGETAPANGFMEWEVPREAPHATDAIPTQYRQNTDMPKWPDAAVSALAQFWQARIDRQREIDASIAAKADHEYLYDKPYEDKKRIRVAGPFTVESLSPHRSTPVDENGELIEERDAATGRRMRGTREAENYHEAMLENLKSAGVQQPERGDAIRFTRLTPW